jgi:hypothetical protein
VTAFAAFVSRRDPFGRFYGKQRQAISVAEAAISFEKRALFRQRLAARFALEHRRVWKDDELAQVLALASQGLREMAT